MSVKGSKDGGCGLTQSCIKSADYHAADDEWLSRHGNRTIFCLVQFKHTRIDTLPRMYLATPAEIGQWLKEAAAGRGDTILYEEHTWSKRAYAAGTTDALPAYWRFTEERLEELASQVEERHSP